MKTSDKNAKLPLLSRFSASIAPINRVNSGVFGALDRVCCASVLATALMLIRLLAK